MAAHLVVPLQKQKQEHQEHGGWLGAPAQGILAPALGWSMAWRSHGAVEQQQHRLVPARGVAATTATNEDAWEVRAFAEDAASCSEQWPPRSYSCSFCAREFRTAQALGGHMNVHRRERAYANQLGLLRSSSSNSSATDVATASATTASTPALGVCWLYPLPVTPSATSNSNLLSHHQVSSTVTTATAVAASESTSISRLSDANRGFQAAPPVCIDRKKMLQDHDPNVDLELRLGQAQ